MAKIPIPFDAALVKTGEAFKLPEVYGTKDFIRYVTTYQDDHIFEYWSYENHGMSQKFGIFQTDYLVRLPEKDLECLK